jgi:ribosome-associated protein
VLRDEPLLDAPRARLPAGAALSADIVTPGGFTIQAEALSEQFVRASGPGGQNVNKVSSAVRLAFDSRVLPEAARLRLKRLAGRRMGADGVLVIAAQRHRTLEANRRDAAERLAALVDEALIPPTPRTPTRTPRAEKRRRLEAKRRRAASKRLRGEAEPE